MTTTTTTAAVVVEVPDEIRALAGTCCRVAGVHDRVDKTECVYTFHSPFTTASGIVVNLQTFVGTIPSMALSPSGQDQEGLFVRIVQERILQQEDDNNNEEDGVPVPTTVLGIGVPGGFASEHDKYTIVSTYSLVHLKKKINDNVVEVVCEIPYTEETKQSLPMMISQSMDSILQHAGSTLQQDVQVWQMDQSDVPVSKYAADLPFCDNGVVISPDPVNWVCEKSGDVENVWLNLSDGYMGGGRQHWDGSGGSNGALDHYKETGCLYPLVVKLGTITADIQTADCYSYAPDEDGPVRVPNLQDLLQKRGIAVASLQKTVKSTAELEVELNANYAFDAITEHSAKLVAVSGPYLQGLTNLGNSCYLNSVVQLLFHIPELANRYGSGSSVTDHALFRAVAPVEAPTHLICQTMKLALALTTGEYARPDPTAAAVVDNNNDPKYKITPRMFKHVIGMNHVDFATGQQQDAAQFLQYFLEQLDRNELKHVQQLRMTTSSNDDDEAFYPSSHIISFGTETRSVCTADQKVKYVTSQQRETLWSIPIPMELAQLVTVTTTTEEEKVVPDGPEQKRHKSTTTTTAMTNTTTTATTEDTESQGTADTDITETPPEPVPRIDLVTCLDQWAAENIVDDMNWPHLGGAKHAALQTTKLRNFPPHLCMQLQRYTLGPDWQPLKLQVELQLPVDPTTGLYVLDLQNYKTNGGPQHATEVLVPDDNDMTTVVPQAAAAAAAAGVVVDEAALGQLMDMGFSRNACQRALNAVGGTNVEAAMGWVFEHNNDPDFNDPLPSETASSAASASSNVDDAAVQSLVEMLGCFTVEQVRFALDETNGQADRAADWLFSHMNELDGVMAAAASAKESGLPAATSTTTTPPLLDSSDCSTYQLTGIISHIGKHTGSGHYVAHLWVNGKWIIFNDEKVAESTQPPVEHAYLYLWQRTDTLSSSSSSQAQLKSE